MKEEDIRPAEVHENYNSLLMKKKCLILGGCGFIGSHITDTLLNNGYQVRIFDKLNVSTKNINHVINDVELIKGDFNNELDIKSVIQGVDYIIHLICSTLPQTSDENPVYDVKNNLVPTVYLLSQASKIKRIKKIIFSSSGGTVYGIPETIPIGENHPTFPICPYGLSKLFIEQYLYYYYQVYGLNSTVLRISNPYGERQPLHSMQGIVSVLIGKVLENKEIEIWGDGHVCRDFLYIKDVANAFLMALGGDNKPNTFNVGSGVKTSINQLINTLEEITGKDIKVRYLKNRSFDVPVNVLKIDRIRDKLGWVPKVSLKDGLKMTWNALKYH